MQSLWMIVACLALASQGALVKLGSETLSAGEMIFWRQLFATLAIWLFARAMGWRVFTPHWRAHAGRSLSGMVGMVCLFTTLGMIPLAMAQTLTYTSSLFFAAMLVLVWRERVSMTLLLNLALGFAGVVLLLRPTIATGQIVGGLIGLLGGFFSSLAFLNMRKLGQLGEPEWRTVFYFSLVGVFVGLPLMLASGPVRALQGEGLPVIAGIAVLGLCGQLSMTMAFKRGKSLAVANLAYLTIVFSSLYGIYFWGERLPPIAWLGAALVVASGALTTFLSYRRA